MNGQWLIRRVVGIVPVLVVGAVMAPLVVPFDGNETRVCPRLAAPPAPEWGAMLNAGREFIRYAPWTMLFPGAALFLAVMAVNLVGDTLSQVLDPRHRGRL